MKKLQIHEIQLKPTSWNLDWFLMNDSSIDKVHKELSKRYGGSIGHYESYMNGDKNMVFDVSSTKESLMKGATRIVMITESKELLILVHELIHVIYHLSDNSGVQLNYQSQEWHAIMMEYLLDECLKA